MEKCPKCGFKTVRVRTVRDDHGKPIETASVCKNCGHILRATKIEVK